MAEKLTILDAAMKFNLTTATLYTAIKKRGLRAEKKYGRIVVTEEWVSRYLANRTVGRPKNGKK